MLGMALVLEGMLQAVGTGEHDVLAWTDRIEGMRLAQFDWRPQIGAPLLRANTLGDSQQGAIIRQSRMPPRARAMFDFRSFRPCNIRMPCLTPMAIATCTQQQRCEQPPA